MKNALGYNQLSKGMGCRPKNSHEASIMDENITSPSPRTKKMFRTG